MIPCLLPVLYAEPILMYIGTEDEVVHYAAEYVLYSVPSIIGIVIFFTLVSVLNACRQFMILGIATSANAIMFLIMASVFVGVLDGKIVGAAMASNLNFIFNIFLIIFLLRRKNPLPGVFFWPKKESFQEIWTLLKYEILVGSMTWCDAVAQEVISILSARLPKNQLAGYTIGGTIYSLITTVTMGISSVAVTYVGNSMGENNPTKAKKYLKSCLILAAGLLIFLEVIGFFAKGIFIGIFVSPDSPVFEYSVLVFNLYMIKLPFDSFNSPLRSCVKATANEKKGVLVTFLCDYLVLVPSGWLLAGYLDLGVTGLISSITLRSVATLIGFAVIFLYCDWGKQALLVKKAIKEYETKKQVEDPKLSQVEEHSLIL